MRSSQLAHASRPRICPRTPIRSNGDHRRSLIGMTRSSQPFVSVSAFERSSDRETVISRASSFTSDQRSARISPTRSPASAASKIAARYRGSAAAATASSPEACCRARAENDQDALAGASAIVPLLASAGSGARTCREDAGGGRRTATVWMTEDEQPALSEGVAAQACDTRGGGAVRTSYRHGRHASPAGDARRRRVALAAGQSSQLLRELDTCAKFRVSPFDHVDNMPNERSLDPFAATPTMLDTD